MKTKEPTQEQIVDFYYYLLMYRSMGYDLCEMDTDFSFYTDVLDKVSSSWPRETSPESYEYYVSEGDINLIVRDHGMATKSIYLNRSGKRKIKITICED